MGFNLGFWRVIGFISFFVLAIGFLGDIFSAISYGVETGQWQPMADATAGKILGADILIYNSMQRLQDPQIDMYDSVLIKQNIYVSLGLLFIFYWILYKAVKGFVGVGKWNGWYFIWVTLIIWLIIFPLAELIYVRVALGQWTFPYKGLWSLFNDGLVNKALFSNGGLYTNPLLQITSPEFNSTINQTLNSSLV